VVKSVMNSRTPEVIRDEVLNMLLEVRMLYDYIINPFPIPRETLKDYITSYSYEMNAKESSSQTFYANHKMENNAFLKDSLMISTKDKPEKNETSVVAQVNRNILATTPTKSKWSNSELSYENFHRSQEAVSYNDMKNDTNSRSSVGKGRIRKQKTYGVPHQEQGERSSKDILKSFPNKRKGLEETKIDIMNLSRSLVIINGSRAREILDALKNSGLISKSTYNKISNAIRSFSNKDVKGKELPFGQDFVLSAYVLNSPLAQKITSLLVRGV